ncbi:MAG: hypothetical protein M3297_11775 [Thermoproteota archaeon]|nr:hypothetical protein [Thermoproteota archaeon]
MNSSTPQVLFLQTHAGVRQDKATPRRSYAASGEPGLTIPPARPTPHHHGSQNRKGQQVKGYVTASEFAEIERLKETGDAELSRQAVVTRLIRIGLSVALDDQHHAMIEPRIVSTIERVLGQYTNRTDSLLAKIFYSMEFFRLLFIRFLKLFVGDNKTVDDLVTDLEREARDNIKHGN